MNGRDEGGRFIKGHKESEEIRAKRINSLRLVGKRLRGFRRSPQTEFKKGHRFSKEVLEQLSISHKGQHSSPKTEFRKGMTPWNKGKTVGIVPSSAFKRGHKSKHIGDTELAKKIRGKISKTVKGLWQDPEYIKRQMRGQQVRPTKPEKQVGELLQQIIPDEFRYNGGYELGISIGGRIPDFVNCNGKKEVSEVFGVYWHSPLYNQKIRPNSMYKETINHYKKYGWKCLIIWDNELSNLDKVIERIKNF